MKRLLNGMRRNQSIRHQLMYLRNEEKCCKFHCIQWKMYIYIGICNIFPWYITDRQAERGEAVEFVDWRVRQIKIGSGWKDTMAVWKWWRKGNGMVRREGGNFSHNWQYGVRSSIVCVGLVLIISIRKGEDEPGGKYSSGRMKAAFSGPPFLSASDRWILEWLFVYIAVLRIRNTYFPLYQIVS